MPYLIDGHNLIGQTPGMSLADPDDERKLVTRLSAYLMRVRKKGTVIFDNGQPGGAGQWSSAVLQVVFARTPASADDLIRRRLAGEKNPRGLVVVSSDQAVAVAARAAHAQVQSSAEFAKQMLKKPAAAAKDDSPLSEEEILAWEKEFKRRRG